MRGGGAVEASMSSKQPEIRGFAHVMKAVLEDDGFQKVMITREDREAWFQGMKRAF